MIHGSSVGSVCIDRRSLERKHTPANQHGNAAPNFHLVRFCSVSFPVGVTWYPRTYRIVPVSDDDAPPGIHSFIHSLIHSAWRRVCVTCLHPKFRCEGRNFLQAYASPSIGGTTRREKKKNSHTTRSFDEIFFFGLGFQQQTTPIDLVFWHPSCTSIHQPPGSCFSRRKSN